MKVRTLLCYRPYSRIAFIDINIKLHVLQDVFAVCQQDYVKTATQNPRIHDTQWHKGDNLSMDLIASFSLLGQDIVLGEE